MTKGQNMLNSKLILLLRGLKKEELKKFDFYLNRIYDKQNGAIKIFNHIKKYHPEYDSKKLEKKYVFDKVFNNEIYKPRKITDIGSDLHLKLKEYLRWEEIKQASFISNLHNIEIFKKRKLDKFYFEEIYKANRQLNKERDKNGLDMFHYLKSMLLYHQEYFSQSTKKISKEKGGIMGVMKQLDLFYIIAKLKYSCELLSRENILQESHQILWINELLEYCSRHEEDLMPLHKLYLVALFLIKEKKPEHYQKLNRLLFDNVQLISINDQLILFSYLVNYKVKDKENNYYEELFSLYKSGLESGILLINDEIGYSHFNNIIVIACKAEEFDWVEEFINNYACKLNKKFKSAAVNISLAYLNFEKKEYEKVLTQIQEIECMDAAFSVRGRALVLRSYFELKEQENLILDYCKAFKVFLKREKILNKKTLSNYFKLISFVRKLLSKKATKASLQKQIEQEPFFLFRKWVSEKINELK